MNGEFFNTNVINSDANSSIRGIFFQKLRAFNRLLEALANDNVGIMCAIEYVDDVVSVDYSDEKSLITAEQDKLKATPISLNSHEVINSIRIFFDNWRERTMKSEKIKFAFYTNTSIAKENITELLRLHGVKLPNEPIIELLINAKYDEVLEVFKLVFKDYYLIQHAKNLGKEKPESLKIYELIISEVTDEEWITFLGLIEWNFGAEDEITLTSKIKKQITLLCNDYDVKDRFVDSIFHEIMSMIEFGTFQNDFLNKVVHVAQVKILFLEKARIIQIDNQIDPSHMQWDVLNCDDVRNIKDKIESVCTDYGDDVEDLQDDYIDGAFVQEQYYNLKAIKAYKYRIYKLCERKLKKIIKESASLKFNKTEIDQHIENLTDECDALIMDISKTYNTIPFKDRDMIRKTILILFEECYLAFDKGGT